MNVIALIPAYNPEKSLVEIISGLTGKGFRHIVVVDDGSSPECASVFYAIKSNADAHVLRHAVNLGKGAALRTGLNFIYCEFPDAAGVVTLDADGQHLPEDAELVAKELEAEPDCLVLGCRSFAEQVPARSRFGNFLTSRLFRILVGVKIADTQTGLRGIPRHFIQTLLKLRSNGYEFELDMLLAWKYTHLPIREVPIHTIYLNGNRSSHFNPLLDSLKIYFVLFRFALTAIATAAVDYTVFYLVCRAGFTIVAAQGLARLVAMVINYITVKNVVFLSHQKHSQVLPRYVALVAVSGTFSYFMITALIALLDIPVIAAKACAEGMIFLANFAIQRELIFRREKHGPAVTDWDSYYAKPFKAAKLSRRVTESLLVNLVHKYSTANLESLHIAELGGANSCFFAGIKKRVNPREYHVYDNNWFGLKQLCQRYGDDNSLFIHHEDVLSLSSSKKYDIVFSVGLIEHFNMEDSKRAIEAHFELLRPGGLAIISFPTPTFLYKGSRWVAKCTGSWVFHDERPLRRDEVVPTLKHFGPILFEKINWPILFTQRVIVAKKVNDKEMPKGTATHTLSLAPCIPPPYDVLQEPHFKRITIDLPSDTS